MKANDLKKKYPETWEDIYNKMVMSLLMIMPQADVELFKDGNKRGRVEIIAHNAAFLGCSELHNKVKQ